MSASGGTYLVLDGPDGCGKSTQAALLVARLRNLGREVLHLREPGSTPVGELLRSLLLDKEVRIEPLSEALLFTAARTELVRQVIAPALDRGEVVVVERCFVSTIAYQCGAHPHGVDHAFVLDITRRAHGPTLPDAIFVLDVAANVAAARRTGRRGDRFEERGVLFHEAVREAYLDYARTDSSCQVLDASQGAEAVHQELVRRVERLLA